MQIELYILKYGYAVILLGTFLEGETVLILAGFLAYRGYLDFPLVVLFAFLGTVAGDQLYFFIGRIKGLPFLNRSHTWRVKSAKVLSILRGHEAWIILGFRFMYGLRTITPFLIGATGIAPARFITLNALGGFAWALLITFLGYMIGNTAGLILRDIKRYEYIITSAIIFIGLGCWLVYFIRKRMKQKTLIGDSVSGDDGTSKSPTVEIKTKKPRASQ
jgi:membrane protein DedA with SNARE-associated domain